jgi:hypothetical protein
MESAMTSRPTCPHCSSILLQWRTPDGSTWGPFLYVCFNDDCSYYQRGWTFMEERVGRKASYRYSLDPDTGATGPLPVWSPSALRADIVPETDDTDDHER